MRVLGTTVCISLVHYLSRFQWAIVSEDSEDVDLDFEFGPSRNSWHPKTPMMNSVYSASESLLTITCMHGLRKKVLHQNPTCACASFLERGSIRSTEERQEKGGVCSSFALNLYDSLWPSN